MIEHERSYVFTHAAAKEFLETHKHSDPILLEDFYLSKGTRIRHYKGETEVYKVTQKTGDKADGFRFEKEEEISAVAAELLKPQATLIISKNRYFIHTDHDGYTVSMDIVHSPMRLAILEIEANDEIRYPVPANICETIFGKRWKECPLCAMKLFKRKVGICGAPSSGKTETAKIISYVLNTKYKANSFHVVEFATTFIQKYNRVPKFPDQFYVWYGQFAREHDAEKANIVISDCPTFLSYIYMVHLQQFDFSEESALYLSKIYKRVVFDLLSYTDIIFLKIKEYSDNNIRYQSAEEAAKIEDRIRRFLEDHRVPHVEATYDDADDILKGLFYINE